MPFGQLAVGDAVRVTVVGELGGLVAGVVLVAFGVGVGLAELFGAKNLGTALGVGQLTFAAALVYVLLRR